MLQWQAVLTVGLQAGGCQPLSRWQSHLQLGEEILSSARTCPQGWCTWLSREIASWEVRGGRAVCHPGRVSVPTGGLRKLTSPGSEPCSATVSLVVSGR